MVGIFCMNPEIYHLLHLPSDIIAKYVYKSLSNKHVLIFVVTSRRGDLEILGYVMLQWLCDRLPWEKNLNDKEYVRNEKTR